VSGQSIVEILGAVPGPRLQALFVDNPDRAAWVRVLAVEGLAAAQLCYGRMLLSGVATAGETSSALEWFRRAAAQNDIDAMNMVGRCLDNGWGVSEDPAAAAIYYRRAARGGSAWAEYNLGHLYLDGRGVRRSFARAYAYYRRAAERGHERAMNLVGRCCEEGWGTVRNALEAAHWYRRSADSGYFRGQYNWASVLLKQGHVEAAVPWLERAANGGNGGVRAAVLTLLNETRSSPPLRELAHRLAAAAPCPA